MRAACPAGRRWMLQVKPFTKLPPTIHGEEERMVLNDWNRIGGEDGDACIQTEA